MKSREACRSGLDKMEIDSTRYLENIIALESGAYKNMFLNPLNTFPPNKEQVLRNVFKINCCERLFEEGFSSDHEFEINILPDWG